MKVAMNFENEAPLCTQLSQRASDRVWCVLAAQTYNLQKLGPAHSPLVRCCRRIICRSCSSLKRICRDSSLRSRHERSFFSLWGVLM